MQPSADPAALVRATFEALFAGNLSVLDDHPGLTELKKRFPPLLIAIPDLRAELKQQLVQDDRVASQWVFRGTHEGELYGAAPTGRPVQCQNISICRVADGRIVQYNSEVGFLSLFHQIGAVPFRG